MHKTKIACMCTHTLPIMAILILNLNLILVKFLDVLNT